MSSVIFAVSDSDPHARNWRRLSRFADLPSLIPAKLGYLQQLGVTDKLSDKEIDDLIAYLSIL